MDSRRISCPTVEQRNRWSIGPASTAQRLWRRVAFESPIVSCCNRCSLSCRYLADGLRCVILELSARRAAVGTARYRVPDSWMYLRHPIMTRLDSNVRYSTIRARVSVVVSTRRGTTKVTLWCLLGNRVYLFGEETTAKEKVPFDFIDQSFEFSRFQRRAESWRLICLSRTDH